MKEYAFGIDLGGTTAKVGLFKTSGELLEKWEVPTDTSNAGEHILENLAAAVKAKMAEKGLSADQVEGVGVGVPGPVLDSRIVPIICANLGGWGNRNVSEEMSAMLGGIKVLVGNDANVAALGEIWMGAAKGCRSAVMVTLGTGVGGGIYCNGSLLHGMMHPEAGHVLIRKRADDTYEGKCPYHKTCLEGLAAGPAIEERWGKKAVELKDRAEVWELEADYLAQAIVDYIMVISPQMVILGGGVMHQEQLFPLIRKKVTEYVAGYVKTEELNDMEHFIVPASLHDDQGIMGCLELARRELAKR